MSVTLASRGTVDQDGLMAVHGTYSCDQPGVIFFNLSARQGEAEDGLSENFLDCPATTSTPYEVLMSTETDTPFRPGHLSVHWDAHFRGDVGGRVVLSGEKSICLRRAAAPVPE
jgi:hypothetical protein